MFIIEFEGLDKSGKNTQSKKLKEYLENKGYKVEMTSFHRYDTPTGKLIRDWLYGEYQVSEETIKLIMAADKQAQMDNFREISKTTDILILDRYSLSNICYRKERLDRQWLIDLQRNYIEPDVTIFIDVTPMESMERKGEHGVNDRYERDRKLLENTRNNYKYELSLREKEGKKVIVVENADNMNRSQISLKLNDAIDKILLELK